MSSPWERRDLLALALSLGAARVIRPSGPGGTDSDSGSRGLQGSGPGSAADSSPAAIGADEGELVFVARDPVRIKISPDGGSGRFAMITQDVSPGTSIPVHCHDAEDEVIFIQAGAGEATLGDKTVPLSAGSTLFVPQGTWHGGRNTGESVLKWIAIYSPSGFEGYFREIGRRAPADPPRRRSAEEMAALDRRFHIRYRR
jgi:mannose-6-phosphate isomerase-like protein (cupin superfamily)